MISTKVYNDLSYIVSTKKHKGGTANAIMIYLELISKSTKNRSELYVSELVENTGLSRNTIMECLSFLKKNGFIISIKRNNDLSNYYYFPKEEMYKSEGITKEYASKVSNDSNKEWDKFCNDYLEPYKERQLELAQSSQTKEADEFIKGYHIPF